MNGCTVLRMTGGRRADVPIRVVIVGERPEVRRCLEIRLALERDLAVVASAASLQATLPWLRRLEPEILVIDLDVCPQLQLSDVARARVEVDGVRVVVLTHNCDVGVSRRAAAVGADDVVDKIAGADPLLASIRRGH